MVRAATVRRAACCPPLAARRADSGGCAPWPSPRPSFAPHRPPAPQRPVPSGGPRAVRRCAAVPVRVRRPGLSAGPAHSCAASGAGGRTAGGHSWRRTADRPAPHRRTGALYCAAAAAAAPPAETRENAAGFMQRHAALGAFMIEIELI